MIKEPYGSNQLLASLIHSLSIFFSASFRYRDAKEIGRHPSVPSCPTCVTYNSIVLMNSETF